MRSYKSTKSLSAGDQSAEHLRLVGRRKGPQFYTIGQVAEAIGVSTRTIRRWIARGDLPVHRFNGVVRIGETDLTTFLALHREV
jgi:excisionase family DNA binding protein